MPIRLIPASSGEPVRLDKPVLLIGRNPDCDVVLTESRKVSRNHCLIACVDDRLYIRDLGSTNGVWINGHRVEREGCLQAGDELSIADLKFAVRQVDRNGTVRPDAARKPEQPQPVSSEHEAGGRRVRKVGVPLPADGDQPVAIPDEDDSFIVEASVPRLPRVRRERIKPKGRSSQQKKSADREEAPPKEARRSKASRKEDPGEALPPPGDSGVLELAEPLNLDLSAEPENVRAEVPADSSAEALLIPEDGATPQGDLAGRKDSPDREALSDQEGLSDVWLPVMDDDGPPPVIPLDD